MGANEKHAATYHGGQYTPDVDDLRDLWVDRKLDPLPRAQGIALVPTVQAEFDRWIETVRAEAKAEALNEAADAFDGSIINIEIFNGDPDLKQEWSFRNSERKSTIQTLRARANQYKEEPNSGR